jgi:outer membrane cobalamin receptor
MGTKEKTGQDGELSEQQLDKVAGGQELRKMETIVVTAKRESQPQKVVKMETIVVSAQRDRPDLAGTKLAQADAKTKKN